MAMATVKFKIDIREEGVEPRGSIANCSTRKVEA